VNDRTARKGTTIPDQEFLDWASRRRRPGEPKRYRKTISVFNRFDRGQIPVKIKADYDTWLGFEEVFINEGKVDYDQIAPFLINSSRMIRYELAAYFERNPDDFSEEFFVLYVLPASTANPKSQMQMNRRPRGLVQKRGVSKIAEMKVAAKHVYIFLKYWVVDRKNGEDPPSEFHALKKEYGRIGPMELVGVTQDLIGKCFGVENEFRDSDPKDFKRGYIDLPKNQLQIIDGFYREYGYIPFDSETRNFPALMAPLKKIVSPVLKKHQ
jgi:hypothetical protein